VECGINSDELSPETSGRTEPIRLFSILIFPSIVNPEASGELAALQQRAAAPKIAKTRIEYDILLCAGHF